MKVLKLNHVYKKFKKGEKFNSLRDFIPNLVKSLFSRNGRSQELEEKEFWALKDVNFSLEKGETVGIIGPNGAGKSTILKLLSRIMQPNMGEIIIKGKLSALIEVTAGFHPDLTGKENIYLNGTILGMKRREIDAKLEEIIEFSGLREFIDTPVKRYSSGMYSRLGFSVAAHMDSDILLVDEVLAVGDMAFQEKCAQKMRELLKYNTTIVLISHNLSLIQSLCKRVILLNKGEIVKEGTPEEIIPYYENVVSRQKEEEMKRKMLSSDYAVKVHEEQAVNIPDINFYDRKNQAKDSFMVQETISIKVDYEAKRPIDNPIFALEVVRADGVLCCSSKEKSLLKRMEGKGSINIDLGQINLAPGIYFVRFAVWSSDKLHLYASRRRDIFRIEAKDQDLDFNDVFITKMDWFLPKRG